MWELDHHPSLPAGYRGLRGSILVALKKAQPLTATELAVQFGVSGTALRKHLRQLEDGGVVEFTREVRGVGAPTSVYSLTQEGEELFPRSYAATLVDALEAVRSSAGDEGVNAFFRRRWERITQQAAPLLDSLELPERVRLLGELMTAHGYMAEVNAASQGESEPAATAGTHAAIEGTVSVTASPGDDAITLTSHNCPLRVVAERFPDACAVEHEYLAEVLDANVVRRSRIVDGCNACCYTITPRASRTAGSRRNLAVMNGTQHQKSAEHRLPDAGRTARSHPPANK